MAKAHSERRRHPRHPSRLRLEGADGEGRVVAEMITENVSMGGLYCSSTVPFPEMTCLSVQMALPPREGVKRKAELISFEAVVVRQERAVADDGTPWYKLALFFTGFEEGGEESLHRYLALDT